MMVWLKRISLFFLVNILVMITINILLTLFNVGPYLSARGVDYRALAIFCLFWGMGGSLISLGLSRIMAKWTMGVQVIDPQTRDPGLQELVQTVHQLARQAGLPKMPEVGVYDSPDLNAFATGPTRSRALVAVSTGLLQRMRREEVEAVLGHEIGHVANGDMVTLTLIQGVINAFVMFLARAIALAISMAGRGDREDNRGPAIGGFGYYMITMLLENVLMFLGFMVVAWFSRWREFRADAAGARLAGRQSMIQALERLRMNTMISEQVATQGAPAFEAFKISGERRSLARLFSTHPPLEERISRLQAAGA